MLDFELVIPCYNESLSLSDLVQQTAQSALEFGINPEQFQLVLVDNGSTDNSAEILATLKLGAFGRWFRYVSIDVNQGVGHGIWTGLSTTTASFVGWMHADLQNNPKDAFRAFTLLKQCQNPEKTLVKGLRAGRDIFSSIQSKVFDAAALIILTIRLKEIGAQPKVFHRGLLYFLKTPPIHSGFDLYVLHKAYINHFTILSIKVLLLHRKYGKSHWAQNLSTRYRAYLFMIKYMIEIRKNTKFQNNKDI